MSDLVERLQNPPFGTETSERNLMLEAAAHITTLEAELDQAVFFINEHKSTITTLEADKAALVARVAELEGALTANGDTKAAYMGEFKFQYIQTDDNGDDYATQVYVPWTTIKEIMAAFLARAALNQEPKP